METKYKILNHRCIGEFRLAFTQITCFAIKCLFKTRKMPSTRNYDWSPFLYRNASKYKLKWRGLLKTSRYDENRLWKGKIISKLLNNIFTLNIARGTLLCKFVCVRSNVNLLWSMNPGWWWTLVNKHIFPFAREFPSVLTWTIACRSYLHATRFIIIHMLAENIIKALSIESALFLVCN